MTPSPLEVAEAFILAGELPDALDLLAAHLQIHPGDQAVLRLRASVAARLPDRARDALADLDALDSLTAADHLLRARIFEDLGDSDSALAALEAAYRLDADPRTAERLLQVLYKRNDVDRALRLLAGLPESWNWLGWHGDFYALSGDDAAAEAYYCSALDRLAQVEASPLIVPQRAALLLKRAEIYRRLERWSDAEADYAAASAIIPNDATIAALRAQIAADR